MKVIELFAFLLLLIAVCVLTLEVTRMQEIQERHTATIYKLAAAVASTLNAMGFVKEQEPSKASRETRPPEETL